jgi:hypothetical protein
MTAIRIVIPAKAGRLYFASFRTEKKSPASAGMTME